MGNWAYTLMVAGAGMMLAFQSPINASLGRLVGPYNATLVSFVVGLVIAIAVPFLTGTVSQLAELPRVSWWQLLGGILGAAFVTSIIIAVPRIGVVQMMIASLAGQLLTAMMIDHYGWFGIPKSPLDLRRMAALPVLALAIWLVQRK